MRLIERWRDRLVRLDERWQGSFSWKVRWRMAHDRNPLLTTVQDKHMVKEYARLRGVRAVASLHVSERPEDIPFDDLPADYFIKASHGCGWNVACIDGELYRYGDGRDFLNDAGRPYGPEVLAPLRLARAECVAQCQDWLGRRYRSAEWAYQGMRPRILIEAAVHQHGGGPLRVYRLFTMAGTVRAIAVGGPLFARTDSDNLFFDLAWRRIAIDREKILIDAEAQGARPASLDAMVAAAERLGAGLDFARIDMYDSVEGVLLGEMTVYPYGGLAGKPSSSRVFNRWLGHQWQLQRHA